MTNHPDRPSAERYGSVPPRRRMLFRGALAAAGIATLIAGLVVNGVTHTPVRWGWLLIAVGFVMGVYALYLWIRLSD
jgi:hypothetical protein